MIKFKNIINQSLNEEIDVAINEFLNCDHLLTENGKIDEGKIGDLVKKVNDYVSFVVKKTGDVTNDAALSIYVKTVSELQRKIQQLSSTSKDRKSGLIMKTLGKIIKGFVDNPKASFTKIRVALLIISLISGAISGYAQSHNPHAFDNVMDKLGIDIGDGGDVSDLQTLADQSEEVLKSKIENSVENLGYDLDNPDYLQQKVDTGRGTDVAPTDLMHDPAYADFQDAIGQIKQLKGDAVADELIKLAKLERKLSEQSFLGSTANVSVQTISGQQEISQAFQSDYLKQFQKDFEIKGIVSSNADRITINSVEFSHNGVVISKMDTIAVDVVEGDKTISRLIQSNSGLNGDITDRMEQLTKGVDDSIVQKIFKGADKFQDWRKISSQWRQPKTENYSFERMMLLAGIINEQGVIQKGINAVKTIASKISGFKEKVFSSLKDKLTKISLGVVDVILSKNTLPKIRDGKQHSFVIKNGKLFLN